jgi:hypothetical protein
MNQPQYQFSGDPQSPTILYNLLNGFIIDFLREERTRESYKKKRKEEVMKELPGFLPL